MHSVENVSHRLQISQLLPDAYRNLHALQQSVEKAAAGAGLDPTLIELVKIRASQLNGCGYCVDKHSHDARRLGESEQRLYLLPTWRETPFFSAQERAALALTEALTRLPHTHDVPDDVYDAAVEALTEQQFAVVAWAATTINAFNRLGVLGRMSPPTR
jgi:AhpD family alkylhydroperoxidase